MEDGLAAAAKGLLTSTQALLAAGDIAELPGRSGFFEFSETAR